MFSDSSSKSVLDQASRPTRAGFAYGDSLAGGGSSGAAKADSSFRLRELSLRQAEEELVGACIDREAALREALRGLAVEPFRSEAASVLGQVFYLLAGWLADGSYEESTNRDQLEAAFDRADELACQAVALAPSGSERRMAKQSEDAAKPGAPIRPSIAASSTNPAKLDESVGRGHTRRPVRPGAERSEVGAVGTGITAISIDALWCGFACSTEYVAALVAALSEASRLEAAAVGAIKALLFGNPLSVNQGLLDAVYFEIADPADKRPTPSRRVGGDIPAKKFVAFREPPVQAATAAQSHGQPTREQHAASRRSEEPVAARPSSSAGDPVRPPVVDWDSARRRGARVSSEADGGEQ